MTRRIVTYGALQRCADTHPHDPHEYWTPGAVCTCAGVPDPEGKVWVLTDVLYVHPPSTRVLGVNDRARRVWV